MPVISVTDPKRFVSDTNPDPTLQVIMDLDLSFQLDLDSFWIRSKYRILFGSGHILNLVFLAIYFILKLKRTKANKDNMHNIQRKTYNLY